MAPMKHLPLTTLSQTPFELWSNGVYSFAVGTSPEHDYTVEMSLGAQRTGLYSFETLSDTYDWLEERHATFSSGLEALAV